MPFTFARRCKKGKYENILGTSSPIPGEQGSDLKRKKSELFIHSYLLAETTLRIVFGRSVHGNVRTPVVCMGPPALYLLLASTLLLLILLPLRDQLKLIHDSVLFVFAFVAIRETTPIVTVTQLPN